MAMLTCAECGNEVSTSARACPNCGASKRAMRRRPRQPMGKWQIIGWALLAFVIIVAAVVHNTTPPPPKTAEEKKQDEQEGIRIAMAKAAAVELKASLRNPDSLVLEKVRVSEDGGVTCIRYRAQNGFGGMGREIFVFTDKDSYTSASAWERYCAHKVMFDYTDTLPMMLRMSS